VTSEFVSVRIRSDSIPTFCMSESNSSLRRTTAIGAPEPSEVPPVQADYRLPSPPNPASSVFHRLRWAHMCDPIASRSRFATSQLSSSHRDAVDFGWPGALSAGHGFQKRVVVVLYREEIRLGSFHFRPPRYPQIWARQFVSCNFYPYPLERSHHSHINLPLAFLLDSPCLFLFSGALFIVSCKTYQLTLLIF
jgi:hypothetical protein